MLTKVINFAKVVSLATASSISSTARLQ